MDKSNYKNELKFMDLCKLCEKISKAEKNKRGLIFHKFVNNFRQYKESKQFYPVLRLLLPKLDRERGAYGLKEFALAKKYIKVLCIPKESADANSLLNFRTPRAGSSSGDFAEVVYFVIKNRQDGGGELYLDEVNTNLDKIADMHASNKSGAVNDVLISMVQRMSPLEIKWLTRILIKDMKLGYGCKGILNAYHPDASELYDYTNNLFKVCDKLSDPKLRLHEIEVSLFDPFRPMLAERCDIQNVDRELTKAPFHFVEAKWDGERCQLHYKNGEYKYFTRRGFNYTDYFGANYHVGSLTPRLSKQLKSTVESVILDGEMMAWNTKYKSFVSKGSNIDVKYLRIGDVQQSCFCAFDILYLNGKVLTNKPLEERIKLLETVFTPCEGVIIQTNSRIVRNGNDVMKLLNDAIDNREEGIILKRPKTIYKPNIRTGGWFKIKPEYTDGAMADLDLLIIGGYYGEGRRRGVVSQFLLAVAVKTNNSDGDAEEFHAVSRVGSGCTNDELAKLGQKLSEHWVKTKSGRCPPSSLVWAKEKPDLWIEPSKSVVLQIKASEIVYSDAYPVQYSLRFPRIEKVRDDKGWQDCLTIKEFHKLRNAASGKLISSHIAFVDKPLKPKCMKRSITKPTVSSYFLGSDLSEVRNISKLLDGKEVCIILNSMELKRAMETKVVEHGGTIVQNPGISTNFVVSENDENIRVKNIIKRGLYDVVTLNWLNIVFESKTIPEFRPDDLISMSKSTQNKMKLAYDEFGDSYTNPATREDLIKSFNRVKTSNKKPKLLDQHELAEIDLVIYNGPSKFAIFRKCTAFFFKFQPKRLEANLWCPLKIAAIKFLGNGGKIVESIDNYVTHVIIHTSDRGYSTEINGCNNDRKNKYVAVNENWIIDSIDKSIRLDESVYIV